MFTVSSCLQSCSDLYSYDWYGNFTGITSVIDLTVGDDPLPPRKRRRRIKQEPAEDVPSDSSSSVMNNTDADCIGVPSNALKTKKSGKESTREKPPPALGRKRNEWKSVRLYREEFEVEVVHRGVCETSEGEGELVRQQFKGHGSKFKSQTNSTGEAVEGLNEESDYDMGRTEQLRGRTRKGRTTEIVETTTDVDDSEVENSHSKNQVKGRLVPARRRRVKMDTTTSEDSEVESNRRSRPTNPRPAPDRKEKMDKQKVSENSVLDMSPSIRPSGQPRREEERARRTHHGVQTLREGDGSEILGDEGNEDGKIFSDDNLRNLRQ